MKVTKKNILFLIIPVFLFTTKSLYSMKQKSTEDATALFRACKEGNLDLVTRLINKGVNINAKDEYGNTPLILASWRKNTKLTSLLIEKGARINDQNNFGYTPLSWACLHQYTKLAKFLIGKGADTNSRTHWSKTSLIITCENVFINVDLATLLINARADINAQDNNGNTPLILASSKSTKIATHLIHKGANVNAVNKYGDTPLINAFYQGYTNLATLLINSGADISYLRKQDRFAQAFGNQLEKDTLLRTHINTLKKRNSPNYILPMKDTIKEINTLMFDHLTPMYTKQLALPSLLEYHQTYPKHITTQQLLSYCHQVVFNYNFFSDKQYKKIRDFAIQNDAKDRFGKSILVAAAYLPKDTVKKTLSTIFETKDTLYQSTGLFKKWENQYYSSPFRTFMNGLFGRRFYSTDQEKAANDFIDALTIAKKRKNKKVFKLLMHFSLYSGYLKEEGIKKKSLPPEIAAKILSFYDPQK